LYIDSPNRTSRDFRRRAPIMLSTLLRRYSAALGLLILVVVTLSLLPMPADDPVVDALLDAGHVPCFGIVALLARRAFALSPMGRAARWRSEFFAL
jgi:hypothetical protein